MKVIIGFLFLFFVEIIYARFSSEQIIRGKDAPEGKYPHIVAIRYKVDCKYHTVCGGSILNHNWILTAAHCITDMKDVKNAIIVAGTTFMEDGSGVIYNIDKTIVHEDFHGEAGEPDIGLIRLTKKIEFSEKIKPIDLPKKPFNKINILLPMAGWGRTSINNKKPSPKLQEIKLNVIDPNECEKLWRNEYPGISNIDQNICTLNTFGEGFCHCDSGSPLMDGSVQVGIASFSYPICASGVPDVYTNVYDYVDWIRKKID